MFLHLSTTKEREIAHANQSLLRLLHRKKIHVLSFQASNLCNASEIQVLL